MACVIVGQFCYLDTVAIIFKHGDCAHSLSGGGTVEFYRQFRLIWGFERDNRISRCPVGYAFVNEGKKEDSLEIGPIGAIDTQIFTITGYSLCDRRP